MLTTEEFHCKMLCTVCYLLGQFEFQKHCYCNAVTPITDLICALFGPYAAMFVNQIYPWKSLKMSFVSPGKPWNLVFASPGKSWKTVFIVCTNPEHTALHTTVVKLPVVWLCIVNFQRSLFTVYVYFSCSLICLCLSLVFVFVLICCCYSAIVAVSVLVCSVTIHI